MDASSFVLRQEELDQIVREWQDHSAADEQSRFRHFSIRAQAAIDSDRRFAEREVLYAAGFPAAALMSSLLATPTALLGDADPDAPSLPSAAQEQASEVFPPSLVAALWSRLAASVSSLLSIAVSRRFFYFALGLYCARFVVYCVVLLVQAHAQDVAERCRRAVVCWEHAPWPCLREYRRRVEHRAHGLYLRLRFNRFVDQVLYVRWSLDRLCQKYSWLACLVLACLYVLEWNGTHTGVQPHAVAPDFYVPYFMYQELKEDGSNAFTDSPTSRMSFCKCQSPENSGDSWPAAMDTTPPASVTIEEQWKSELAQTVAEEERATTLSVIDMPGQLISRGEVDDVRQYKKCPRWHASTVYTP